MLRIATSSYWYPIGKGLDEKNRSGFDNGVNGKGFGKFNGFGGGF